VTPIIGRLVGFFGRDLLGLVWAVELVLILWPNVLLKDVLLGAFAIFLVVALARATRRSQITVAVLVVAGYALFPAEGGFAALLDGLRMSVVFAAFLPTMFLARATADHNPEIERSRSAFAAMAGPNRNAGFLFGSHAIGAIVTAGAFAVMSAILPREASPEERRRAALAALRGMNIAVLWSPFFVAMAVASHHVPGVPLWHTALLGVPLAATGLAIGFFAFSGASGGRAALIESLRALTPSLPLLLIAGCSIVLVGAVTSLSSLQAVLLTVPPLCLIDIVRRGRRGVLAVALPIAAATRASLGRINDDLVLLTGAVLFGRVLEANPGVTGMLAQLAGFGLPVVALLAGAMAFMLIAAVAGVHPVVTMTLVLVTLGGEASRLAPVVLLELGLYGWALGTMVSMSSVSIAVAAAMFRVPVPRLAFAENLRYVLMFGAVSSLLLALANRALVGAF